jgi:hypothetical protein
MLALIKNSKTKVFLLLVISILTLNSCGIGLLVRGAVKKTITVENKVVPTKFIEAEETLIILMWEDGSYDKYAKKAFDKFYKGKKVYINFKEFKTNEKYQDLDDYPYVFSQGPGDMRMYEGNSYSFSYSGSRPFHIYDRREGTFSKSKVTSGFFYRVMQAYAMKLDTYRR